MRFAIVFLSLFVSSFAVAQIDPSSALLLNQETPQPTREGGLDSGRYTKKPVAKPAASSQPQQQPAKREEVRVIRSNEKTHDGTQESVEFQLPQPTIIANPDPNSFLGGAEPELPPQPPVQEVILGGSEEEVELYKEMLNPEDRRRNLMELSLAPMFVYNSSKSPYLYRDYTTAGPGVSAEARVWFSPFFGVQGSYTATLSGSVSDSFTESKYVSASQTWLRAGIRSRSFLTTGKNSPSLTWGADFYEYIFRVPKDSENRGRLRTIGAQISLEGELPTSARHSWLLGLSFLPKGSHKEYPTELQLSSGQRVETNGVGISLGTRIQYDRKSAMFLRVSHQLEKHVFTGEAGLVDPRTNEKPSGVPVLNSHTMLQLGYTWGN